MLKTRIHELLVCAKDLHTVQHGHDPNHDWVSFYADVIDTGLKKSHPVLHALDKLESETGVIVHHAISGKNKRLDDLISNYEGPTNDDHQ